MFGTNHNKVKPFSPSSRQKTVAPADEISGRSFLIRAASFVNNNNPIQPSPPEEKKEEIDFSLDYLGRFRDPKLQEEFIIACLEHRSTFSFLILSLSLLVWLLIENFLSPFQLSSSKVQGSVEIAVIVICVVAIILSITIYVCSITSLTKNHLIHTYVQLFFGISINVLFIMKIVEVIGEGGNSCLPSVDHLIEHLQIHVKPYIATSEINNVYDAISKELLCLQCTQHSSDFFTINSLAQVIMLSLCPQLLMAILHEPRLYLTFTSHFLTGGLLIFTISVQGNLIIPLAFMIIAIAVVLYEIHIQRTQYFLNNRKLQDILNKNEKNALEIHAMEMRSMIGNVAHDLKTPLASFTNGLDIIKEILFSASVKAQAKGQIGNDIFNDLFLPIQTCLMSMRNTNAFMLMTINRCIDYMKASKGMKLVPKYETVDLREALQFPIECMSNIQERIGIKLEAMSGEICSHIITDKQWLQENLLCLLSNAVKYSTEGSVTIKVFKQCQLPKTMDFRMSRRFDPCAEGTLEHYLLFEIEDTGIGLSEEAMKHLFNPFKQAQRLAGGTGLGLYSLAKRVEALNGNYGVRKRTDRRQGSLFWFAIPYKADTAASAAAEGVTIKSMAREAVVEYKADAPADNLKILIVDDAPSILKMSSMMLKRQGHQIWTAENGEIALKRIEEKWRGSGKGFDLVLMDLQMPVMDGLEATRRLRAMEAEGRDSSFEISLTSHLLIFGVSANSDHDTMKAAFDAGVDDFIGKPFSIDALNKCLQKFNS